MGMGWWSDKWERGGIVTNAKADGLTDGEGHLTNGDGHLTNGEGHLTNGKGLVV
jgi:hypothetical protein